MDGRGKGSLVPHCSELLGVCGRKWCSVFENTIGKIGLFLVIAMLDQNESIFCSLVNACLGIALLD